MPQSMFPLPLVSPSPCYHVPAPKLLAKDSASLLTGIKVNHVFVTFVINVKICLHFMRSVHDQCSANNGDNTPNLILDFDRSIASIVKQWSGRSAG